MLLPAQSTSKGLTAPLDNAVRSAGSSYLSVLIYGKHHSLEAINPACILLGLKCISCLWERRINEQTNLKKKQQQNNTVENRVREENTAGCSSVVSFLEIKERSVNT